MLRNIYVSSWRYSFFGLGRRFNPQIQVQHERRASDEWIFGSNRFENVIRHPTDVAGDTEHIGEPHAIYLVQLS